MALFKKTIRWQLFLATILLLAILQLVSMVASYKIAMALMHSCTPIPGFLSWQCSGNTDPEPWMIGAILIVPPLLAKALFYKFKITVSWKKIVIINLILVVLNFAIFALSDLTNNCGCGGA
jgi:hypothetical protein